MQAWFRYGMKKYHIDFLSLSIRQGNLLHPIPECMASGSFLVAKNCNILKRLASLVLGWAERREVFRHTELALNIRFNRTHRNDDSPITKYAGQSNKFTIVEPALLTEENKTSLYDLQNHAGCTDISLKLFSAEHYKLKYYCIGNLQSKEKVLLG